MSSGIYFFIHTRVDSVAEKCRVSTICLSNAISVAKLRHFRLSSNGEHIFIVSYILRYDTNLFWWLWNAKMHTALSIVNASNCAWRLGRTLDSIRGNCISIKILSVDWRDMLSIEMMMCFRCNISIQYVSFHSRQGNKIYWRIFGILIASRKGEMFVCVGPIIRLA